jgi:DNA replication and repair protein RecF
MKIKKLTLRNFRNYNEQEIVFDDGLNVLVGKNAQGKTNILEAIFFAVIGKSFKTSKDKEVILWEQERGLIKGEFERKYRDVTIEIVFDSKLKKQVSVDGISLKRIGELLGHANAVFFSPDELKLIKESPEERRRFMNIDISQTNKRYFYLLGRYDKILANRNKLLKTSKDLQTLKQTIDIWDRALCEVSEKIAFERAKFIEELAPLAKKAHAYISGGNEKLEVSYNGYKEDYQKLMLSSLQKNLNKDFKLGYTSLGVHRDDIDIYLNGVEVKSFGSQGQQRTVALSLKLAELEIIKNRIGEYPILLLDDVFSELDESRRKKLLKFTSKTQTIITCTEFNEADAKIFNIKNGKVV